MPEAASAPIPRFATLEEMLAPVIVLPSARQVLQRCAAGQACEFGPVRIDAVSICAQKRPVLRWQEAAGWKLSNAELTIRRGDDNGTRLTVDLRRVPDGLLLAGAIAERLGPPN